LVQLAILLQGIFAGVFAEPGRHSGALNAHELRRSKATLPLPSVNDWVTDTETVPARLKAGRHRPAS